MKADSKVSAMHSTLTSAPKRPCIQCQHFGEWVAGSAAIWCLHGQVVHALPQSGCAYWTQKAENPLQPKPEGANVRPT